MFAYLWKTTKRVHCRLGMEMSSKNVKVINLHFLNYLSYNPVKIILHWDATLPQHTDELKIYLQNLHQYNFQRFYQLIFYSNKRAFEGQDSWLRSFQNFESRNKIFTKCSKKKKIRLQFCRKMNVKINLKIIYQFEPSIFHFWVLK